MIKRSPVLGVIAVIALILFSAAVIYFNRKGQEVNPLLLTAFSPQDKAMGVSTNSQISVTFSRPLSSQEADAVKLSSNPSVTFKKSVAANTTLIFIPVSPLEPGQTYRMELSYTGGQKNWSFITISYSALTSEDKLKLQTKSDQEFGSLVDNVYKNYPWYDKLPLQTNDYFVFFNTDKREFQATLYPKNSSNTPLDKQAEELRAQILKSLDTLGIETKQYNFNWDIKPE